MKWLIALLVLFPLLLGAQTKYFLPVPIESSNGRPIQNREVAIYSSDGVTSVVACTWQDGGRYYITNISNVHPGRYDIKVNTTGAGWITLYDNIYLQFSSQSLISGGTGLFAPDTSELKTATVGESDTATIFLAQLSATNTSGSGFFVQIDSAYAEGIFAYDNATIGKQWVRIEYLSNPGYFNMEWAGDDTSFQKIADQMPVMGGVLYIPRNLDVSAMNDVAIFENPVIIVGDNIEILGPGLLDLWRFYNSVSISGLTFKDMRKAIDISQIGDDVNGQPYATVTIKGCKFINVKTQIYAYHSHGDAQSGANFIDQLTVRDCYSDSSQKALEIEDIVIRNILIDNWDMHYVFWDSIPVYNSDLTGSAAFTIFRFGYDYDWVAGGDSLFENFECHSSNITIKNCDIDTIIVRPNWYRSGGVLQRSQTTLIVNYRKSVKMENCTFNYFMSPDTTLQIHYTYYARNGDHIIDNCTFIDAGATQNGMIHDKGSGVRKITNNIFKFTQSYLDSLDQTTYLSVKPQRHIAIDASNASAYIDWDISGNYFEGGHNAIYSKARFSQSGVDDSLRVIKIRDNFFTDQINQSITFYDAPLGYCDIQNNVFWGRDYTVIDFQCHVGANSDTASVHKGITIKNNKFLECTGSYAIYSQVMPKWMVIDGNEIFNATGFSPTLIAVLPRQGYYRGDSLDCDLYIRNNIAQNGYPSLSAAYLFDAKIKNVFLENNNFGGYSFGFRSVGHPVTPKDSIINLNINNNNVSECLNDPAIYFESTYNPIIKNNLGITTSNQGTNYITNNDSATIRHELFSYGNLPYRIWVMPKDSVKSWVSEYNSQRFTVKLDSTFQASDTLWFDWKAEVSQVEEVDDAFDWFKDIEGSSVLLLGHAGVITHYNASDSLGIEFTDSVDTWYNQIKGAEEPYFEASSDTYFPTIEYAPVTGATDITGYDRVYFNNTQYLRQSGDTTLFNYMHDGTGGWFAMVFYNNSSSGVTEVYAYNANQNGHTGFRVLKDADTVYAEIYNGTVRSCIGLDTLTSNSWNLFQFSYTDHSGTNDMKVKANNSAIDKKNQTTTPDAVNGSTNQLWLGNSAIAPDSTVTLYHWLDGEPTDTQMDNYATEIDNIYDLW